jgi:methionyl aminopeptidase
MIEIYRGAELLRLRRAGQCAAQTLATTLASLKAGMSTAEINRFVADDTAARGATSSQLGYHGFPGVVCVSRNDVVCHGVPSEIGDGDIVNVDVTSCLDGFHGDTSKTVPIGRVSADKAHVIDVVERCLAAGISVVRPGARVGDIGAAIVEIARAAGCSIVTDFGSHGIGRQMHQDPHISHVGVRGRGPPRGGHVLHHRAHGERRPPRGARAR